MDGNYEPRLAVFRNLNHNLGRNHLQGLSNAMLFLHIVPFCMPYLNELSLFWLSARMDGPPGLLNCVKHDNEVSCFN